jgi:hypothetical protein
METLYERMQQRKHRHILSSAKFSSRVLLFQDHHLKEDKEKKTLSSECRFQ